MIARYKYETPKYFKESKVSFLDHSNNERIGMITDVQTNYDELNIAFHTYIISVEGNLNRIKVLENKIQYSIS